MTMVRNVQRHSDLAVTLSVCKIRLTAETRRPQSYLSKTLRSLRLGARID